MTGPDMRGASATLPRSRARWTEIENLEARHKEIVGKLTPRDFYGDLAVHAKFDDFGPVLSIGSDHAVDAISDLSSLPGVQAPIKRIVPFGEHAV